MAENSCRKEIIINDLRAVCEPKANISSVRELSKWNPVYYETNEIAGYMLTALAEARPDDVSFNPNLSGWYRIFVGQPMCWSSGNRSNVNIKLSSDGAFMHFSQNSKMVYAKNQMQEAFWRCADMTGESVIFAKEKYGKALDCAVGWIRFEPMTESEVEAFKKDSARTDTKRIYATNDMHGMLTLYGYQGDEWKAVVDEYLQSDVEWISMENIRIFDGDVTTGDNKNFAYPRPADERAQRLIKQEITLDTYKKITEYGKQKGYKMCASLRMGGWAMEFPFDQMYFENTFGKSHKECRCIDRDGLPIDAMSYIYPEVQDYVIERLTEMAGVGVDAVELIATRGVPYTLFEKPFTDMFTERYGKDPRVLPLDDERVMDLHCEVLYGFFKRLRAALDEKTGKNKTRIHLRAMYSIYDCRYLGFDIVRLAKEGLINGYISFPQRLREDLSGDVWADGAHTEIDLKKYTKFARENDAPVIIRYTDLNEAPPLPDSKGVLRGPENQAARVKELMQLEKQYGVTVYFDIMPRIMTTAEIRDRAAELYGLGAERFSLWDTYARAPYKTYWTMVRRLGHKDELKSYDSGEGELYRMLRVLKYGDKDVSRYMPSWGG